jgi:hypothetical protein
MTLDMVLEKEFFLSAPSVSRNFFTRMREHTRGIVRKISLPAQHQRSTTWEVDLLQKSFKCEI